MVCVSTPMCLCPGWKLVEGRACGKAAVEALDRHGASMRWYNFCVDRVECAINAYSMHVPRLSNRRTRRPSSDLLMRKERICWRSSLYHRNAGHPCREYRMAATLSVLLL